LRPDESATGPPRLPFVLSVGVTGHRLDTLSVEAISALSGRVSSALKLISQTALQIHNSISLRTFGVQIGEDFDKI